MESTLGIPGGVIDAVPSGTIVMFHGASIPLGWALCDGSNGTPDLRDRFIVGAGRSYNLGATGGCNEVTLTISQMPSHSHVMVDSKHSHQISIYRSSRYGSTAGDVDVMRYASAEHITTTANSSSVTCQSCGSDAAHENRPPYYALYFIMKL